ncbi:MAG: helix-turn-helix transcriptional regulator [Bryobacteraceae bacterium]|jgi:transcriptional regulator with XRE-family HTH domain
MTNDNMTLGEAVHDARARLKLSLRDVAKSLAITPSYLSDIENDRRVPSEEVLRKLANFLGLDPDDLMALAGRFGEEAVRYMMKTPAAGMLFRRLAEVNASGDAIKELLKAANEAIEREKGQSK